MGHAVAHLVEALRYKPEGCGFDSRWCHWNLSLTWFFRPHYGPGVDSASNRIEYQGYLLGGKGGWCLRLTTLPFHVPIVLKSGSFNLLEPSGPVQTCNGIALPLPKALTYFFPLFLRYLLYCEMHLIFRLSHDLSVRLLPFNLRR